MKPNKRALLHDADRRLRRNLALIALILGFPTLLVFRAFFDGTVPDTGPRLEAWKLLLQLLLVTTGGGVILAIVGNARDEAARRQGRAAAIQSLDRELDAAYRALKRAKRKLRAHGAHLRRSSEPPQHAAADAGADAEPPPPPRIPKAEFEQGMDELLKAQIELETICGHIGERDDIIEPRRLARMEGPLRYAARYYHDVYEDFERRKVSLVGSEYDLSGADNLNDFLSQSRTAPQPIAVFVRRAARRISADGRPLRRRLLAFRVFVRRTYGRHGSGAVAGDEGKQRYAAVAAACFDLLSAELADARARLLS